MINYNTIVYIFKNLDSAITDEKLSEALEVSVATIRRLKKTEQSYKRPPSSIRYEQYLQAFHKYKKEYFRNSSADITAVIINLLRNKNIRDDDINRKITDYQIKSQNYTDAEFEEFVSLLFHKALLSYSPEQGNKAAQSDELPISNVFSLESSGKIAYKTYSDLRNLGMSELDVARQLLENDKALYGNLGEHAGTAEQWAQHIKVKPENWGFLCQGQKIIGNWSCTFLTLEQESAVKTGTIKGIEFEANHSIDPLSAPDGEVAVHLLNMSINKEYQSEENLLILWRSFAEMLQNLAKLGTFYRSISVSSFIPEHDKMFRDMGFKYLCDRVITGKIYWLDLVNGMPPQFGKIMPNSKLEDLYNEHWGATIEFVQLSKRNELTHQENIDISLLLHDTDKYIYNAMMSRQQAKRILPHLIASSNNKDSMFSKENLFIAKAGKRVIGVILFKKGPLNWNSGELRKYAEFEGEILPETLKKVEEEYFTEYNNTEENVISIINCCVHSNWRYNLGIGSRMMAAFIQNHRQEILQLYVLKETPAAMRVYERNGFELVNVCNGFSVDNRNLPCGFMVRYPKNDM